MKTFSINTLGCKVNQYESQQIRQFLEQLGLKQVKADKNTDLAIINTCCVTQNASSKSRQYINKAKKRNPNAQIVIFGCLATVQIDELNAAGKNIHIVRQQQNLANELNRIIKGQKPDSEPDFRPHNLIKAKNNYEIKSKNKLSNQPKLTKLTSFKGHTRAFLKIQDGCDGYCSYCIIPKTRPDIYSKPAKEVLLEAENLVSAGHKEIVLTGIYLGAYGQKTVKRKKWQGENKFAEILEKVAQIPKLERIRLSSLEPGDVTEKLLNVICSNHNIMPHLHLSLQAGSDRILEKMNRQYRMTEFMQTIEMIKHRMDRPAITTDIIVGFPTETDDDYQETIQAVKRIGFAKMHIFPFSARKGTAAEKMENDVDSKTIKERAKILQQLNNKLSTQFRQQFVGENITVLTEQNHKGIYGRSERYFVVNFENDNDKIKKNQMVKVKLTQNNKNGMAGLIVKF